MPGRAALGARRGDDADLVAVAEQHRQGAAVVSGDGELAGAVVVAGDGPGGAGGEPGVRVGRVLMGGVLG